MEPSTKRTADALGIGIAIVKRIMADYNHDPKVRKIEDEFWTENAIQALKNLKKEVLLKTSNYMRGYSK
jgi:hypothetical protein